MQTPIVLLLDNNYYPCLIDNLYEFAGDMPDMPYKDDLTDCDDFAFKYKDIAAKVTNSVGIILGRYEGKMHAWNVAITNIGVWQVEPQSKLIFRHYKDYRPMVVLL